MCQGFFLRGSREVFLRSGVIDNYNNTESPETPIWVIKPYCFFVQINLVTRIRHSECTIRFVMLIVTWRLRAFLGVWIYFGVPVYIWVSRPRCGMRLRARVITKYMGPLFFNSERPDLYGFMLIAVSACAAPCFCACARGCWLWASPIFSTCCRSLCLSDSPSGAKWRNTVFQLWNDGRGVS